MRNILLSLFLVTIILQSTILGEIGEGYSPIKPLSTVTELNLLRPNGGEILFSGTIDTIRWTYQNLLNIKIEFSTDNGTVWTVIAESISASNGLYEWMLPNIHSTTCKVRISSDSNPQLSDESDSTFKVLMENPLVPVQTSPLDNTTGLSQPIIAIWSASSHAEKYIFQLSTDSSFTNLVVNDSTITDTIKLLPVLPDYTQYFWRVKAVNIGGESDWSQIWNFKTLGSAYAVELVSPDNQSINQPVNGLTFNWKKPQERIETILKYQYQLSTDSLFGSFIINDTTLTDTVKTVNNLNHLTNYYWRVRASNETGWGDWSNVWRTTTIIEKPAITVLALPINNATKLLQPITLKWNKTPRAEKYWLEVSEFSNFSTLLLVDSTLTDTLNVLPQLEYPKTYYWRVRGSNIGGMGDYSVVWNFRTLGLPLIVDLVLPANNSVNQPVSGLTFSWKIAGEENLLTKSVKGKNKNIASEGINRDDPGYAIENLKGNEFQSDGSQSSSPESILKYWMQVNSDTSSTAFFYNDSTITDTIKTLSGFGYLTNYYWRVKAMNENGWGTFSNWNKFTTIIDRPSKPLLALPVNNSIGLLQPVVLVWNKSLRAEKYTLQVSETPQFTTIVFSDTSLTDTSKTLPTLLPLKLYYWRVSARNIGGKSDTSDVWSFKTLGTPATVNLVYPGNNAQNIPTSLTFVWNKAYTQESITRYWFELVMDTTAGIVVRDTMLTDTTRAVSSIQNNKDYYWRVKAKNEAGWGNFSAWFKFRTIVALPGTTTLSAPGNNSTGIPLNPTLVWRKPANSVSYHLQVASDSLFSNFVVNDSSIIDTLIVIDTLNYKTRYFWRVRSGNIAGWGNFSSVWRFTTCIRPINRPTNLAAAAINAGSINLSWTDNSDNELGFIVLRKQGDSTSSNQLSIIDTVLTNLTAFIDSTIGDSVKYSYKVYAYNSDTLSAHSNFATVVSLMSIREISSGELPKEYSIAQNYPNPFNPSTTLRYGLPFDSDVKIEIFDITGQRVTELVNSEHNAGQYEVSFSINGLSSGIYFYVMNAKQINGEGHFNQIRKMILMK